MHAWIRPFCEKNEIGILYGNDSSALPVVESVDILRQKKDSMMIGSGYIFQSMNSTVSMNLSVIFRLKGVNFTVSGACASGSHAIGIGYLMIQQGLQDIIICGGAQEINPESTASFDALNAFSVRESEPQKASRPFDRDRDGLVPSGGAATVILESYESAVRRGAQIFGEVVGYGFSSNGEHISLPDGDVDERQKTPLGIPLQRPLKGTAVLTQPVACPATSICPPHFQLQFGALDSAVFQAAFLGAKAKGTMLSTLIDHFRSTATPPWPVLKGTVKADSLILGPVLPRP